MTSFKAALCAAALLPLLGGCVAIVAVPAVMGAGLMVRSDHRVRAATRVPHEPPAVTLKTKEAQTPALAVPSTGASLTALKELPAPGAATASGEASSAWAPFVTYALAQAQAKPPQSALLAPGSRTDMPVRHACPAATPAVIVDLDDGPTTFAPEHAAPPSTALAEGLARLREGGVVVLWITRLPAARAPEVAQWVRSTGLDPTGDDQFLLVRNAQDRKQVLREEANHDVCVVAVAGSTNDAFDELFDYLRDPAEAIGLDPMKGKGWFTVPPLAVSAAEPTTSPPPASATSPAP